MSKLTQIQTALKEINEAKFQQLCDAYLHKQNLGLINPVGSATGKEKTTKGTPDTLFRLPNGKYIFVEYTTQEKGLFAKLIDDLRKCFDERKTGIPVSDMETIILCHNSSLQLVEETRLIDLCQSQGCLLRIIGIGQLSYDLYTNCPKLLRDFLDIEVDTGQIVAPSDFVTEYQKSSFATPLDTDFCARETELQDVADALESNNLIIISGKAGVGKSRLALECCKRFVTQNEEYTSYCILNKSLPLYADLKDYFSSSRNYIILVDDANRVSDLNNVLDLLRNKSRPQHIKIVLTVRDYAVDKVRQISSDYVAKSEVALQHLDRDQIKRIVSTKYGIHNYLYLERICDIAKGNPRLAMMAAKIAIDTNDLTSISDVTSLYDTYFGSINVDLGITSSQETQKVAGLVAFLGAWDLTDKARMLKITEAFNLTEAIIRESIHKLYEMEVVDLYEGEVVKSTDQVLSTYLFYRVFVKDRTLDFYALLHNFFESHRHRFIDTLNPVLEAFDSVFVCNRLQNSVDEEWTILKDDEQKLLKFMDVFWFLKQNESLLYLKEQIDVLVEEPVAEGQDSPKTRRSLNDDPYLSVLSLFSGAKIENCQIALELISLYLEKRPTVLPNVLKLLTGKFSFQYYSYRQAYAIQHTVVNTLIEKEKDSSQRPLYKKLLFGMAGHFLKTQFMSDSMLSRNTLSVHNFCIVPSPELVLMRETIWSFLFENFAVAEYEKPVLDILSTYSKYAQDEVVREIIAADAEVVINHIKTVFQSSNYGHCVVAQKYFAFLERHALLNNVHLKHVFQNASTKIADVLLTDSFERMKIGWEQYSLHKEQLITEFCAGFIFTDYRDLFTCCVDIIEYDAGQSTSVQLYSAISKILARLAKQDRDLFNKVITELLQSGNKLFYYDVFGELADKIIKMCDKPIDAYKLLKQNDFNLKDWWLFHFLSHLSQDLVDAYFLSEVYVLYNFADFSQIPSNLEYLRPYQHLDHQVLPNAVEILYNRSIESDQHFDFRTIIEPYGEASLTLDEVFGDNIDLLKRVYLHQVEIEPHIDYDGETFTAILIKAPDFIEQYTKHWLDRTLYSSYHDDQRNYNFLWQLDNYCDLATKAVEAVYKHQLYSFGGGYLNTFFIRHDGKVDAEVEKRKLVFLTKYIEEHCKDRKHMLLIFEAITNSLPDKRLQCLEVFLKFNKNYEAFEALEIDPSSYNYSGSAIPVFEKKVLFLEGLLPLLSKIEFLKHRQLIENKIMSWKRKIEDEARKDFADMF